MEWLKKIRENKNLSQEKVAELAGVDRSMISKLENGSAMPSVETAQSIANILGFNLTRFFESDQEAS